MTDIIAIEQIHEVPDFLDKEWGQVGIVVVYLDFLGKMIEACVPDLCSLGVLPLADGPARAGTLQEEIRID